MAAIQYLNGQRLLQKRALKEMPIGQFEDAVFDEDALVIRVVRGDDVGDAAAPQQARHLVDRRVEHAVEDDQVAGGDLLGDEPAQGRGEAQMFALRAIGKRAHEPGGGGAGARADGQHAIGIGLAKNGALRTCGGQALGEAEDGLFHADRSRAIEGGVVGEIKVYLHNESWSIPLAAGMRGARHGKTQRRETTAASSNGQL